MNNDLMKDLISALQKKDLAGVERALSCGADPNGYVNGSHDRPTIRPPMVEAASHNFVEGLELLRRHGGLVDGPLDYDKTTPLIAACVTCQQDAGYWLVDHGADIKKTGAMGTPALEVAIMYGSVPLAQKMIDTHPELSGEALTTAAAHSLVMPPARSPEMTRWLLERGVNPNLCHDDRSWLIHLQSSSSDEFGASAEMLLAAGAAVDWQTEKGFTALYFTALTESQSGFIRLLRAGANPDLPDHLGQTLRQYLELRDERRDMLDTLKAWEASHAAHQAIDGAQTLSGLKPL